MEKDILQSIRELLREELRPINERLETIENDVKYIKEKHGEKLDILLEFEKNIQFANEKVDARLSKIDNRLRVLAEEDFDIKTDIVSVKEELKVIRGGKE
jgi:chromosome segregation ATPase